MAETTGISWCDHTSNIAIGCTKVGPGCDNCYAERDDLRRYSKTLGGATKEIPIIHWGPGAPRHFRLDAWTKDIFAWNRKAHAAGVRRRVFIDSLSDFFDNEWPWQIRDQAWAVMRQCTALDFLIATKRPGNIAGMLPPEWAAFGPFPNVWILVSIVTQEEADRDIVKFLAVPAAVHGLSIEPQLEHVDVRMYLTRRFLLGADCLPGVDWVICGGESGSKARPFNVGWARSLRDQCAIAKVPFFMKQVGANPYTDEPDLTFGGESELARKHIDHPTRWAPVLKDRAGADPEEWPADLRIQQFPNRNTNHER